jgi:phage terminase small subunit
MTPLSKELLLPPRQAHFVEAYCMGQNATKAAMAAGYSIKTAHVQESRMLKNVKVLSKIEDRMLVHRERCSITVDTLTAELEEARTLAMMTNKPAAAISFILVVG